ncbi:MAG: putative glycoside hydrolase [Candidatus Liptonbacteria bacterium]
MRFFILKYLGISFMAGLILAGIFLSFKESRMEIVPSGGIPPDSSPEDGLFGSIKDKYLGIFMDKEETKATSSVPEEEGASSSKQNPLSDPPTIVKGLYLTGWTAGSEKRLKQIISLAKEKGLNGVVVDVKDYSGYLTYKTGLAEVAATGAEKELRVENMDSAIKQLHENDLYVIARITVFQDPILSQARPDWALQDKTKGGLWRDRKGLSWLDPAAPEVWAYHVSLAKNALERGFDEVNFDYIRFPSDGDLANIKYPFWDEKISRREILRDFFEYLRSNLSDAKISADLFGMTTYAADDLGIGQIIEDAYSNFDFICPMVYPSHYGAGVLGLKNPAEHPYEVIKYSMEAALARRNKMSLASSTTSTVILQIPPRLAKLRPWLQAFDLGAVYDREMINKQIVATQEVLNSTSSDSYAGWLLWDPKNIYTNFQP